MSYLFLRICYVLMKWDKEFIRYFNLKLYLSWTKNNPYLKGSLFFENKIASLAASSCLRLGPNELYECAVLAAALHEEEGIQPHLSRSTAAPLARCGLLWPMLKSKGALCVLIDYIKTFTHPLYYFNSILSKIVHWNIRAKLARV